MGLGGTPLAADMDNRPFNDHVKLNYRVGDRLRLTVLRPGDRREIEIGARWI